MTHWPRLQSFDYDNRANQHAEGSLNRVFGMRFKIVELTLKDGRIVEGGQDWELFPAYLIINSQQVAYDEIVSFRHLVEGCPGFGFGHILTQEATEEGWSDWEERNDLGYFIERLLAGNWMKVSVDVGQIQPGWIEGPISSLTRDRVAFGGSAFSVRTRKIIWVSHKLA